MADFAYSGATKFATLGANTADSSAVTLTSSTSTNTKGSWVQITSSTAFQACGFILNLTKLNHAQRMSVDVAVDVGGTKYLIVDDLYFRSSGSIGTNTNIYVPINLPAGSNVYARCQSDGSSHPCEIEMILVGGHSLNAVSYSKMKCFGFNAASTDGPYKNMSGVGNNTKSGYTEIIASTPFQTSALAISFSNIVSNNVNMLFDFATGAASSEQIFIPNFHTCSDVTAMHSHLCGPFPCSIPAGTRLSYRVQASFAGAGEYAIPLLYGFA